MKVFFIVSLTIIMVVGLILTGCAKPAPSPAPAKPTPAPAPAPTSAPAPKPAEQPQYGGNFKMFVVGGIPAWDAPTDAKSFIDMRVANAVFDRILWFDKSGNWTPNLATNYQTSADGKTVTLTLRKGVKFHDGTELTAKDIKFHIENFTLFGTKMGVSGGFKNVASIDAIDDYTVRLNLSKPDGALPVQLALMNGTLNSSTAVKKPTTPENQAKDHVAGSGPFKFVEWKRDVYFKTEKFANFWQTGKPYLDTYEVDFMADPVSALIALQAGQGQGLYGIAPKDASELKTKGYQVFSAPFTNYVLVPDGDNADSPFANAKVRQAVDYAIDKKVIASSFGFGFWEPLNQIVTPDMTMAYNPTLAPRTYDVEKAKQLLKDAGYPNGFDTNIYAQTSDNRDLLTALQTYLGAVGIRAQFQIGDAARYNGEWASKGWKNGLIFRGYGFQMNILENFTNWWRHPPNGSMFASIYYPPNWDNRCDSTISEPNPETRKTMVQGLVKSIFDDAMAIPICTGPMIFAFDKSVRGGETFAPVSPHLLSPAGLWLSK